MIAGRHAAGDLHIDDAVADAVAAHDLAHDDAQRGRRHRPDDPQFAKRTGEPRHVAALVDQPAAAHLADLVDAVGKLVAPVLDVHHGVGVRQVAAVDVGDPRHRRPFNPANRRR